MEDIKRKQNKEGKEEKKVTCTSITENLLRAYLSNKIAHISIHAYKGYDHI